MCQEHVGDSSFQVFIAYQAILPFAIPTHSGFLVYLKLQTYQHPFPQLFGAISLFPIRKILEFDLTTKLVSLTAAITFSVFTFQYEVKA